MKLRKALKYVCVALCVLLLAAAGFIYVSGPKPPASAERVIDEVLRAQLPELVTGRTGFASNGSVRIWYEAIEPTERPKGTIILVMGISADALGWPDYFLKGLVDGGYSVIRYDHRGTGLSDWMDNWDSKHPYSLDDMAADALAVLDALEIEEAHVVGVSMGGMIAQTLAIQYPSRVLSLTSMMSSGDVTDPSLPPLSRDVVNGLVRAHLKYGLVPTERNTVRMHIVVRQLLMGHAIDDAHMRCVAQQVLYSLRRRKGFNRNVSPQHLAATAASGSRHAALRKLTLPTLIVHGMSDPFVPLAHGRKTADSIRHASTLWVPGMGHYIPQEFSAVLVGRILEHLSVSIAP